MSMSIIDLRRQLNWEPKVVPAPKPVSWSAYANGEEVEYEPDDRSSIVLRGDTVLGRVTPAYKPFYNARLLAVVRQAMQEGWTLDSYSEFLNGRSVAVNLKLDSFDGDLLGDGDRSYASEGLITILNSHTGKEALRMFPVIRKITCRNQLPFYNMRRAWRWQHSGDKAGFPSGIFASIAKSIVTSGKMLGDMARERIDFEEFVDELLESHVDPSDDDPDPRNTQLWKRYSRALMSAYDHPTAPPPGSAFAAVQAVVFADEHIIGRGAWRKQYGSDLSQNAVALAAGM